MTTIADILEHKGNEVHQIAPSATVFDAIKIMVEKKIGSLIVTSSDEILGIITERDYLTRVAIEGRTSRNTPVKDVMSNKLVCVSPWTDVEECMAIMSGKRIRHLPVIDQGKLVGIVSIGDMIKKLAKDRKVQIRYLTDYISGKYPG